MKYAVVYTEHPSPSQARVLRQTLGSNGIWTSVLPLISAPVVDEEELLPALELLHTLEGPSQATAVFVQPDVSQITPLPRADAIALIQISDWWVKFVQDFDVRQDDIYFAAENILAAGWWQPPSREEGSHQEWASSWTNIQEESCHDGI